MVDALNKWIKLSENSEILVLYSQVFPAVLNAIFFFRILMESWFQAHVCVFEARKHSADLN